MTEAQPAEIYGELSSGKSARFDEKLVHLLTGTARLFADQGYDKASMRQVAQAVEISLPGLYYYVSCKEELLFLIQYHTFGVLAEGLENYQVREPQILLAEKIQEAFSSDKTLVAEAATGTGK